MYGPRIVNISPKQTVDVGDSLELDCVVDGALVEGMELAWVKILGVDDLEYLTVYSVEEGNMEYIEDLESELTDDDDGGQIWTMVMDSVKRRDAGLYQCQLLMSQQLISSREAVVKVKDKSRPRDSFVFVKHGGNVTLDCLDCGNRHCDGQRSRVSLIRVDKSDSGVYTCWVKNRRVNFTVIVEHPPIINNSAQSSVFQAPGYTATLHCHVSGVPVPLITWTQVKTGEAVRSSSQHSVSISNFSDDLISSSLSFYNVTHDDYGEYACNAENYLGITYKAELNNLNMILMILFSGQTSQIFHLKYSSRPVLKTSSSSESFLITSNNLVFALIFAFIFSREII